MKPFFHLTPLPDVLALTRRFAPAAAETVDLQDCCGRVLAVDQTAAEDLPGFSRATMDGVAVRAADTFGASEGAPAYLTLVGSVAMGAIPRVRIAPGQTVRIATGGMLPEGADAVVMVEHTEAFDAQTVEVLRAVAPGQHTVAAGEDAARGERVLPRGRRLRPPEVGLLAALGCTRVPVYPRPKVAIISTGDEVVAVDRRPTGGQIRDINSYTLAAQVAEAGGSPVRCGVVADCFEELRGVCARALADSDMVLLSGGSSVGVRDYTLDVLNALPGAELLVHGITISPGKPTILAAVQGKPLWGLPGHVTSAMVVFSAVVRPFLDRLAGRRTPPRGFRLQARLSRSVPSAQGRDDYIRVALEERDGQLWAEPLLGKSGLLRTMVRADGLIVVDANTEGVDKHARVAVTPL